MGKDDAIQGMMIMVFNLKLDTGNRDSGTILLILTYPYVSLLSRGSCK